jgi:large subunit ribosomal protein L17
MAEDLLMRHRRKVTKLNRTNSHKKALLRNLVSQLFVHERITTTDAKAKALRPFAERLITMAKNDTVHSRRNVTRQISDKTVVKKLFTEVSPRFMDRSGGYTRIMKLTNRLGDNAKMSIIELVEKGTTPRPSSARGDQTVEAASEGRAGDVEKKGVGRRLKRKMKVRKEKESGD